MEEEKIGTEVTEADLAVFDDDWDSPAAGETAESGEDTQVTETTENAGTETAEAGETPSDTTEATQAEPAGEPGQPTEGKAEDKDGAGDQRFELVYMQKPVSVGREEVIQLAQKGMDYDRVVQQREDLRQTVEGFGGVDNLRQFAGLLKELSDGSGMTVEQVIDSTRAGLIARRDKVDMAIATERAKAQRLQAAIDARSRRETEEQTRQKTEQDRQNAQFTAFMRAYPDVKADQVPHEVWDAFRRGEDLTSAYARYDARKAREELAQVKSQIETLQKNNANRSKAASSQQTAGVKDGRIDPFDEGWDIE